MWMIWLLTSSLVPLVGLPCHGELQKCSTGPLIGACREGVQSCIANQWGPCLCGQEPTQEICDCKDNDCDGQIDENCSCGCPGSKRSCGFSPAGQCQQGVQTCVGLGVWGNCVGTIGPNKERCDGKDNDCDGQIDEDLNCGPCTNGESRTCFDHGTAAIGEGPCKAGTETCTGNKWGPCIGQILPGTEICDNIDNDCNGYVDGLERLCGSSIGTCQQGVQACELGAWGPCRGERTPSIEICDCKDNDCDGNIDEDATCPTPGDICYHGRCVPNCFQGKCIQPDEHTPQEPSHEPPPPEPTSREEASAATDNTDAGALPDSPHDALPQQETPPQETSTDTQIPDAASDMTSIEIATNHDATPFEQAPGESQIPTIPIKGCGCQGFGTSGIGSLLIGFLLLCLLRTRPAGTNR